MSNMKDLIIKVCVILYLRVLTHAGRIYMDKCDDFKGFGCTKSEQVTGRIDVTFTCNPRTSWDIELYLWQFRSISTINSLTVVNCTNVTLNLQCTNELRYIQSIRIFNVTRLTIPSLVHGLTQTPPQIILEDIGKIDTFFTKTFIQIKKFSYSRYGCSNPLKDLENIVFKNVRIGTIERDAFYNLTDFKNFTFDNVTVGKIEANAVHVFAEKNGEIRISRSNISVMEFMSFHVRGSKFSFISNEIKEIQSAGIKTTIYSFDFHNNSVGWLHTGAMLILAQNVKISDSNFDYLSTGAFQTIGPGLPENALQGFGDLNFNYEFKNNLVESLEIGSLHPDWRAYRKVGGNLIITYNALKCSCAELAWLYHKEGFGKEFSSLDEFHEKILNIENKNLCIDSPCVLPVDAVRHMVIKDGRCLHNFTQNDLCNIYNPTTAITRRSAFKPLYTTPYLQFFKRSRYGIPKSKSCRNCVNFILYIIMLVFSALII